MSEDTQDLDFTGDKTQPGSTLHLPKRNPEASNFLAPLAMHSLHCGACGQPLGNATLLEAAPGEQYLKCIMTRCAQRGRIIKVNWQRVSDYELIEGE